MSRVQKHTGNAGSLNSMSEFRPLAGKRILVTRARSQVSELAEKIHALGGEAIEFPVIRIQPPTRAEAILAIDSAFAELERFDWIVFTSVNGVAYFFERLRSEVQRNNPVELCPGRPRIAAVGPKTANALRSYGLTAEIVPEVYDGEGLLEALLPHVRPGERLLLPTADIAREIIPQTLRKHGMHVTKLDIYETVTHCEFETDILALLRNRMIDLITFTSSSTVTHFFSAILQLDPSLPTELLPNIKIACIGPLTAETAKQMGLKITYLAKEATIDSLLEEIVRSERG